MTETATFGGGCFWCVEAVFLRVRGVERVVSGYAGGEEPDPTYRQVAAGATSHAEVVQVTFDPEVITFRELVEIFLTTHDPTTPNRQGNDVGPQYRSIVLYESEAQREAAEAVIAAFDEDGVYSAPIVTEVEPLTRFYPAEAYHQDYYARNPEQPYCQFVVAPKVTKLRKAFAHKLKAA